MAAQYAGRRDDKIQDLLVGGVASANLEQINRTFFWSDTSRGTLGILCRDADGNAMTRGAADVSSGVVEPLEPGTTGVRLVLSERGG